MKALATVADLTLMQLFALASIGFDDKHGAPFDSRADALAAWEHHREALMARCPPGERPWAFWALDVGRPELTSDDPREGIAPDDFCEPAQEPLVEMPKPSAAKRRAFHERMAREERLAQRRRDYLGA